LGSAPLDSTKMRGVVRELSLKDPAISNTGGEINFSPICSQMKF
jgi:hypothetical protein